MPGRCAPSQPAINAGRSRTSKGSGWPTRRRDVVRLILGILLTGAMAIGAAASVYVRPARAHDLYAGWVNPATGASCCNNQDCRPARSYLGDDGRHYVFLTGRWKQVPVERVLKIPSPGGNSHVCANVQTDEIYCFVPGQPKS